MSGLARAFRCRLSTVLPAVSESGSYAAHGHVWHRFMQRVVELRADRSGSLAEARDLAALEAPPTYRDTMRAVPLESLEQLDLDPARCAVEVAYAYDVVKDEARELGRGLDRAYGALGDDEYAGTTDYVSLVGMDAVQIRDYKTLQAARRPVKDNVQVKALALAACRATGRVCADVEIVRLGEDGEPWSDQARLNAYDLDAFADELLNLHARIRKDREAYAKGDLPMATVADDSCTYCHSARYCPAQMNLVQGLTVAHDQRFFPLGSEKIVMDEEMARRLVDLVPMAEKRLAEIKAALKLYAAQTPVPLGDGRFYGPRPDVRRKIADPKLAGEVLTKRLGAAPALAALDPAAISMDGLERARKTYFEEHPEEKVKGAVGKLDAEIEAILHQAGALRLYDAPVITTYKPKVDATVLGITERAKGSAGG